MSKYDELPVYKASYDLLLEIYKFTKNFTKEYKYTIGESLKKETVELIKLSYQQWAARKRARVLFFCVWKFVERARPLSPSVSGTISSFAT